MSKHRVSRYGPLLALFVLALVLPASPASMAVREPGQTATTLSVSGRVTTPSNTAAGGAVVWLAPLTISGAFDWPQASGQSTYLDGRFSFSVDGPGRYGLVINPPPNDTDSLPLRDYTFTVPSSVHSVRLGDIKLQPASKKIEGTVQLKLPSGASDLSGVSVHAVNHDTQAYRHTSTDSNGRFGFGVSPGEWDVYTSNNPGATWQLRDPTVTLSFPDDSTAETRTLELFAYPTVGQIVGAVRMPDGSPLAPPPRGGWRPYVYAYGENGSSGRYEYIDSTGAFTMPVLADTYTLEVVIDQDSYPLLSSPAPITVSVVSGTVTVPTLTVASADATLRGVVTDTATGSPVADTYVQAYTDSGLWRDVYTAADGSYSFSLTEGEWNISVYPDDGYLQDNTFARVFVPSGDTATQDFALTSAAAIVTGSFALDGAGTPLSNINGWAYARDENLNYVAWGPIERGSFSLSVPAGNLRVGVQLAPGSRYSLKAEVDVGPLRTQLASSDELSTAAMAALEAAPFEQEVVVKPAQAGPALRSVVIPMLENNGVITGTLRDALSNEPITGVDVVVAVTPATGGDAYQWTNVVSSTGTFSMPVAAGDWSLSYYLENGEGSLYAQPWVESVTLSVPADGSASADIFLAGLDGVIAGTLSSEGAPLADKLVWLSSESFGDYTYTAGDGTFSIRVPTRGPGGGQLSYTLGTDFTCPTVSECYYDIEPRPAVVTRPGGELVSRSQSFNANKIDANPVGANGADLVGMVVGTNNKPLQGVAIRSEQSDIPDSAGLATATSDDVFQRNNKNYNFRLVITYNPNKRPTSNITGRIKVSNTYYDFTTLLDPARRAGASLTQEEPLVIEVDPSAGLPVVPPVEFDAQTGFATTLPDGTQIEIPPGAVPLRSTDRNGAGQGMVRATITPTYNLYPTEQYAEAGRYGFEIALTAVHSNRPLTERLLAPMRVTLRYDMTDIRENKIRERQLRAARLTGQAWEPAGAFVADATANKVTFQTSDLGLWALVQQREACGQCIYLPMVGR